ncbi:MULTISPECIES: DNA mismatch endonuclease Vsr [Enterobacterales]|jgi:DNA mismatch endonuclease (patch repair protein)|uniref:Very short patch repair endonuclease n=1 Tax=Candidatus Pantoea symbiotica TaxID=1884370 RepID=A0A1I3STR9_9GAMM|nr:MULTISPECIES: DNA mismatch endonuclease Vsr [Enterobacterales]MRS17606.1 DNA mismatch endonuclease Vsr [Enterobacteriaceae bacterium RIT692]MRT23457.1 DNA mismatch endonuclease Vsr [Enterobacteriaceae bacterium RIT697]KAJ9432669.1 DNA mismatch endonuclease Vsr [Pantoea sp. YR343]MBB3304027.1 DNA mismatch endonuclease (patch repair protein) [Enterobacter sp. Sphag1F]NWA59831.1 DNA mismatch endonuclease Vsr [Pantoea sp. B9002]
MADVHSQAIRSKNMRAIRNQDTAIEQRIALILKDRGFTYRVQDKALPGRPDFVLPAEKAIIFVHGCFWHRHHCYLFKMPATRTEFWSGKINSNVERDRRYVEQLREGGWKVLIVWECALRGKLQLEDSALIERLEEWLLAATDSSEIDHQGLHHYRVE